MSSMACSTTRPDLSIGTHHTDGGAVSDHNFALAYLLGFYFAPRIPNLAERRLYTFGPTSAWPGLEPFTAGRVDEKLITTRWNDVLRLATSVRTGTVSASLLLKRLGAYPRQNGLALALRESDGSSARCSCSTGSSCQDCGGRRPWNSTRANRATP
jgi:TnpA family transposase